MLTLLFSILLVLIFGKLVFVATGAAWTITKILMTIVFLPLVLISIFLSGFVALAFAALIMIGLFSTFRYVF